jgi:hypothetical protein
MYFSVIPFDLRLDLPFLDARHDRVLIMDFGGSECRKGIEGLY